MKLVTASQKFKDILLGRKGYDEIDDSILKVETCPFSNNKVH